MLLEVLSGLGHRDDDLYEALLRFLDTNAEQAAGYLADYGDPRALESIPAAFDRIDPQADAGEPSETGWTSVDWTGAKKKNFALWNGLPAPGAISPAGVGVVRNTRNAIWSRTAVPAFEGTPRSANSDTTGYSGGLPVREVCITLS